MSRLGGNAWNLAPATCYGALCCLREHQAGGNKSLTPEDWGRCAEHKGIYHPRKHDGTTRNIRTRYQAWGVKAGKFLAQLGLAKRHVCRVSYNVCTGYTVTRAGQRWLKEYERNSEKERV